MKWVYFEVKSSIFNRSFTKDHYLRVLIIYYSQIIFLKIKCCFLVTILIHFCLNVPLDSLKGHKATPVLGTETIDNLFIINGFIISRRWIIAIILPLLFYCFVNSFQRPVYVLLSISKCFTFKMLIYFIRASLFQITTNVPCTLQDDFINPCPKFGTNWIVALMTSRRRLIEND